jgi:DNA-binding MarR family transcriptional regulator
MKLEKEIAQPSFKDEYHKAAINLMFTYNWLIYQNDQFFKEHDITPQQYNVLRILRGQYPSKSNLKLVKERMLDRMSDVSRIVDKLCKKGYIERTECPADRRNVDLLISARGLETLSKLDYIDAQFKKMLSNLDEREVRTLNELLDKVRG